MSTTLILIISVALTTLLVIKETRRKNRAWLAGRIIASIAAVAALAGLQLRVNSPFNLHRRAKTAVVLTGGAADANLQAVKNYPAFSLSEDPDEDPPKGAAPIADLGHFIQTSGFSHFELAGYGTSAENLSLLKGKPVKFHPAALPEGVISVNWKAKLSPGEPLVVRGRFHHPSRNAVKLVLKGAGLTLDSLPFTLGADLPFSLHASPKFPGKNKFTLVALSGKDTLETEPVPFEVQKTSGLKILSIASAPGFEQKFLRTWLAGKGFGVAARATISKGKWSTAFLNLPATGLKTFTPALLSGFDLLIADRQSLNTLSSNEAGNLAAAVRNGMGLLIATDSLLKQSPLIPGDLKLYELPPLAQRVLVFPLPGSKVSLPVDRPVFISPAPGSQVVLKEEKNGIGVATQLVGKGKVTLSALPETYPLQLSGNTAGYSELWSLIIQKTIRNRQQNEDWNIACRFGRTGERQQIMFTPPGNTVPGITNGQTVLPPQQGTLDPGKWSVSEWPVVPGWQTVKRTGGSAFSWYVYGTRDWKALRAADDLRRTSRFIRENASGPAIVPEEQVPVEVPKIYFLLVFLLCCAFLWGEPKFL